MTYRSVCAYGAAILLASSIVCSAPADASPAAGDTFSMPAPRPHHHKRHAPAKATAPLASAAPAPVAPTSSPAPVPNEAVAAPIDNQSTETSVAPSVFQLHYPPQGDGYTTGSSSQALDDREAAKATGVEMKVPLPQ